MKSINRMFLLLLLLLGSISLTSYSQNCNNYNQALSNFKKGQYDNVPVILKECTDNFTRPVENTAIVYKTYKLIITSYRNIDQDGLAQKKMEELYDLIGDKKTADRILANTKIE